jgi:glycosyltransferase involved in cell wall biosynthesis
MGFLRKSDPEQLKQICEAYRKSHFLVLPTKADTFGIVFCEAQAFGVLPVTYDVGGTGSAVVNGETGLLLPLDAEAKRFAEEILRYINNPELYHDLSERCRNHYLDRANWRTWSKLILELAA